LHFRSSRLLSSSQEPHESSNSPQDNQQQQNSAADGQPDPQSRIGTALARGSNTLITPSISRTAPRSGDPHPTFGTLDVAFWIRARRLWNNRSAIWTTMSHDAPRSSMEDEEISLCRPFYAGKRAIRNGGPSYLGLSSLHSVPRQEKRKPRLISVSVASLL
jgi:hypothetical protein